jgi:multidrug transporter EmrE-like cation transporter
MVPLLLILISGLLGVVGQIVLKQALVSGGPLPVGLDTAPLLIWQLATNPLVVVGLTIYLSGTFFWLVALSRVDLGYAYPLASMNYIFVLVGSWIVLGERPTPVRLLGVVGICAGVWLLSRTHASTGQNVARPPRPRPAIGGTHS